MRLLLLAGALRLFAGPHVGREMDEKIDGWMATRGVDPAAARLVWANFYRPAIRFIEMGSYGGRDRRVVDLAPRDVDDVPTAALAILLGRKALSEDAIFQTSAWRPAVRG